MKTTSRGPSAPSGVVLGALAASSFGAGVTLRTQHHCQVGFAEKDHPSDSSGSSLGISALPRWSYELKYFNRLEKASLANQRFSSSHPTEKSEILKSEILKKPSTTAPSLGTFHSFTISPRPGTIPPMERERTFTDKLVLFLAEGFGVGRIPFAPGTFGTLVGFGWIWILNYLAFRYFIPFGQFGVSLFMTVGPFGFYLAGTVAGILAAVWVGARAEKILGLKDPGRIVIDEIAAMPVAWCLFFLCYLHPGMAPPLWVEMLSVFGLFRLFDIWKPWPVKQSQDLPGGWGLTIDDILAAVYVNMALATGILMISLAGTFIRGSGLK